MLIYRFVLFCWHLAIRIAALRNSKARAWVAGRSQWKANVAKTFQSGTNNHNWVWVHCASLGEFEQGRPLIEKLKSERPELKVLLSFYSPSGYEIRKDYPFADKVIYLPPDSPSNARALLDIVNPRLIVFVKYEFWLFYLREIARRKIPCILISAAFRPNQVFFRWYGEIFRKALKTFDHIFTQDQSSVDLLQTIGIQNTSVAGDTRVDRVLSLVAQAEQIPSVEAFCADHKVWICGSVWPDDVALILPFYQAQLKPAGWKLILVPHDPAHYALRLPDAIYFSRVSPEEVSSSHIMIIDTVGLLNRIYRYGSMSYIGGGFGKGIHNTLEPAAWGLPVLFGPRYHKFMEAREMIDAGCAQSVSDLPTLRQAFETLDQSNARQQILSYLRSKSGATKIIVEYIHSSSGSAI